MVCASADAANVKLTVGGYANWYTGYVGGNNAMKEAATYEGVRSFEHVPVVGDVEIDFTGETVLQNGIKIGAVIELSGVSPDSEFAKEDQSYVYVDGAIGRFAIGKMDTISKQFHKASKDVGLLGIQGSDIGMLRPCFGQMMENISTDIRYMDDYATLAYISPKFYGVTLAASYSTLDNDATHNISGNDVSYAATVAYNNTFGKVTVDADVSYARFDKLYYYVETAEYAIATGVRVGVAGFTVGGGYKFQNNKYYTGDTDIFDAGVAYENGPYGVSLSYIYQKRDYDYPENRKDQMVLASFAYNVTEGGDTFVSLAYVNAKGYWYDNMDAYILAGGIGLTF